MSRAQEEYGELLRGDNNSSKSDMILRTLPAARPLKVCIVGAGVSGLRAAGLLVQHGVNVTILEARNRIGGRLCQSELKGRLVDLGPNWIHGTENNPINDLAHKTNTQLHSWEENQALIDSQGQPVPVEDAEAVSRHFWGWIADAFQYSNQHFESIPPGKSLYDYMKDKADKEYNEDPSDKAKRHRELVLKEVEAWGPFVGQPIQKQSLKFFWLEEGIEGENPFVAGSFKKILEAIAEPALQRANLKLGHLVTRIETSNGGSSQDHKAEATKSVRISTQQDFKEEFDEVIVTLPLGCLKSNTEMFSPRLPGRIEQAISAIGYGNLDKVYFTFPTAWWNNLTPEAAAAETSQSSASATISLLQNPKAPLDQGQTTTQSDELYAPFTHWLSPEYAPETNPKHWNISCLNYSHLPPPSNTLTLLFYIYGDCAKHVSSIVAKHTDASETPHEAGPELSKELLSFFKPYLSRLPNYSENDASCTPTGILATSWAKDPLSGHGSYSNFPVGLEKGDEDLKIMRHGSPERHLWLAGEHCAPFVALGTATGAWLSGEGVAKRILKSYGIVQK